MPETPITAAVIVIGNEILSGRTKDENLVYMATKLGAMGIRLAEARVVADKTEAIVEAVNACRNRYTYVFTTGGIGPTHDDITARSIAAALNLPVERNMEAVHRLAPQYKPGDLNEARLSMADMPVGAKLIDNPVSRAPGSLQCNRPAIIRCRTSQRSLSRPMQIRLPSLRSPRMLLPWALSSGGSKVRSTKGLAMRTASSVCPRMRLSRASM